MTNPNQQNQGQPPNMPAQLGSTEPRWQPIPPPAPVPPPNVSGGVAPTSCPQCPTRRHRGVRLVAVALLLIAVVIAIRFLGAIVRFLQTIGDIGSDDPQAQLKGFAAFGFCAICVLAALRIALNAEGKGGD